MIYRILAKLLDYPNDELAAVLREVRERIATDAGIGREEAETVQAFLDRYEAMAMTDWQADYVKTFDMVPAHALYLTHHLFGDDKNRGPALIDLTEYYKGYGLELASNELPDFLPLILEFSDMLSPEESMVFLSQWSKVFKQLADNLDEAGSPYASLVRLIEQRSRLVKLAA